MNTTLLKWLSMVTVFVCLMVFAANVTAKKPVKPPPDPDPVDDATCVDSGSFFPAFVYDVSIDLPGDPLGSISELVLSNAAGDCTIPIYRGRANGASFRLFQDRPSRIVFSDNRDDIKKLYLLNFTIIDEEVIEELPLSPTLLTSSPYAVGETRTGTIHYHDLSPSGDRVLFTGYERNIDGIDEYHTYFIDEMEIDCAPACRQRLFETRPDANGEYVHINRPLYGLEGQRIYFEILPGGYPNRELVFIERDENGLWPAVDYNSSSDSTLSTDPTLILAHQDGELGAGSLGYWDYDGTGPREIIAHPRSIILGVRTIEILDVEDCLATMPPGGDSCVLIGSRSDSGIVIEGRRPNLTSRNGTPPDLMYFRELKNNAGYSILEFDLTDFDERILIKAIKDHHLSLSEVDSAD